MNSPHREAEATH